MDEGRGFCIQTVQAVGGFVDESVVLGDKLPADLRRNDIAMSGGSRGIGHAEEKQDVCGQSRETTTELT